MNNRFPRFGVNYVPSKGWWYTWLDWDAPSIADDLATIASLGVDHLRIHCLWPIFQPSPNKVSTNALNHLVELLDIADDNNLDVSVCVLDGWLSGFTFFPSWLKSQNMFTSSDAIAAEKRLFAEISSAIGGHPRFLGYDLGNELGVLQQGANAVTSKEADDWQTAMFDHLEQVSPGKMHVNGVDHQHWFHDFGFSRPALATQGALTSLHTWIKFTGAMDRYNPLDEGCIHLPEYCIELAKAYHVDLDRGVWLQEFGATIDWMPENDIPTFAERTVHAALSCSNLWGMTWWSSHDIDERFTEFDPNEYDCGLIDVNNRVKPVGETMAALIAAVRASDTGYSLLRTEALVVPDNVFETISDPPTWSAGEAFIDLIRSGIRPGIVLESRASDQDYLATRGITKLHAIGQ